MPSLADSWDGKYMGTGVHDVTIVGRKQFTANSGAEGIEFSFRDVAGRTINDAFYPKNEKTWWRIANLAKACGMTKAQAAEFDPSLPQNMGWFLNRRLKINVAKPEGKKYHEVVEYVVPEKGAALPASAPPTDDGPPLSIYDSPRYAPPDPELDRDIPF